MVPGYDRKVLDRVIITCALAALVGCGGEIPVEREIPPTPRRMVLWLDSNGVDEDTADRLQRVGVDEVVMHKGSVDLRGEMPVVRFHPAGRVEGSIPMGIVLEVPGVRPGLDEETASAVWQALETELGGQLPAELILDLPELAEGTGEFLVSLQRVSGLSVVPILSALQLETELGLEVATAARTCLVPSFGSENLMLRGIGERDPLPLREKLSSLGDRGVRARIGIVIQPLTLPTISGTGEDLNRLTEGGVASVSTSSVLDRTFTFNQGVNWSGRSWSKGDTVAIRWMDASRLRAAMAESQHLVLPELAGWDLAVLPADGHELGLSRESLIRYLGGEGPEPDVTLDVERSGRNLRFSLSNTHVFSTAVSNHGNWVQVSVDEGWLRAEGRGSFERLARGTVSGDDWEQGDFERVNAARYFEVYLAPGEKVVSGRLIVPSSRSQVTVRYNLTLFDGTAVVGQLVR